MEMETLVGYNFPVKIVVLNNGGIGPGMPEIPENPMFNMKPNSLIYERRPLRPDDGSLRRQGLLCRRPEGPEGRP